MLEFLSLSEQDRRSIIRQVSVGTGMSVKAIEKDWWVTLALKAIFSLLMQEHFIFKGGTSLSKGWKLTERFSEDIDIALAPEAFGETYIPKPGHSYIKRLKRKGCDYTSTVIKDALLHQFAAIGVPQGIIAVTAADIDPLIPDKDPQTLLITYPSLFDQNPYIAEAVRVEFGVRSYKEPFSNVSIKSIIAEEIGITIYSEQPFIILAAEPKKTFMEKMLLLHEKFAGNLPSVAAGERQSRHLVDLYQMMKKGIAKQVIDNPELYAVIVEHRRYYVKLKNVDYTNLQIMAFLKFIPLLELIDQFCIDYQAMQEEMIYGESPRFDEMLNKLEELREQIMRH
ncbi:MAG TPA: nucleotidyl transferase AbiEii/AbiGii toxin family protein [Chitinophagaceae bacterium]|nr:nucleotidyl transferase AbiEii/AbiGii toxin family protein [Chitinophagaceae bacterium]